MPINDDIYNPNEAVSLPVENAAGDTVKPVLICEELGIPIHFDPRRGEFVANMNRDTEGRGTSALLHTSSFQEILRRIRERALTVPVKAFVIDYGTSREQVIRLTPCEVIEHHKGRQRPYVVRYESVEWVRRPGGAQPDTIKRTRVRQAGDVYLPTPEQVGQLRDVLLRELDMKRRHTEEADAMRAEARVAWEGLTKLGSDAIRYVQATGQQTAATPEDLGLVTFDSTEEGSNDE